MPADGPRDLGDRIVWYKNGTIHREDGPAIEFKDGRKLWALQGQEVAEQEAAAHRQENDRQARERSDEMWQRHEAGQQSQYHTGLEKPMPVPGALKLKKPAETD